MTKVSPETWKKIFIDTLYECKQGRFGNYQCSEDTIQSGMMRSLYLTNIILASETAADLIRELLNTGFIEREKIDSMEISNLKLTAKGSDHWNKLNEEGFREKTIRELSKEEII